MRLSVLPLLYLLAFSQADCGKSGQCHVPGRLSAPAMARPEPDRTGRAGRFFHERVKHGPNSTSTYNICRLLTSGDVELNPGPTAPVSSTKTDRSLKILSQNVRSIRNKLGVLRASAPELDDYDCIAWTETWLNETVDTAELASALPGHTWYRRDRPTHAGGVACA